MGELNMLQQSRLDFMQNNLRRIRSICEWSGNDLADLIGVSRQSINNLEINKSKMTPAILIALTGVLEEFCKKIPSSRNLLDACVADFPQSELVEKGKVSIESLCSLWFSEYPRQFAMTKERTYSKNVPSSMQIMETIASNYKIFVCPNILATDNRLSRIEDLCVLAKEAGNVVNVLASAFKEIVVDIDESAKKRIAQLENDESIIFRGDVNDPPLEKLIIEKFVVYKDKYNLCLITDDKKLADDVLLLNNMKSLDSNTIIVINIDENGVLNFCDDNVPHQLKIANSSNENFDFENETEEKENAQGWSEI